MKTLIAAWQWALTLNAFELAALVAVAGWGLCCVMFAALYIYLAAASGAGETNDGEEGDQGEDSEDAKIKRWGAWK